MMNLLYATIHYKKQFHEIKTKNLELINISRTDFDSTFIFFLKCVVCLPSFFFTERGPVSLPFCVQNYTRQINETYDGFQNVKCKT